MAAEVVVAQKQVSGGTPATQDSKPKKRAVVLIHGMGNQSPMTTLRGFVEAVWTTHDELGGEDRGQTWAVPDEALDSHELKRITTRGDADGVRTDFFEFYWAHLMRETQLSSVLWWLQHLLFRRLRNVPIGVRFRWLLAWAATIVLGVFLVWMAWSALAFVVPDFRVAPLWIHLASVVGLGLVLWFLRHRILIEVVGDAARYLTASPENIGARAAIRDAGVALLRSLHEAEGYDRIIVVGHSLGSVIGYDVVSAYWTEIRKTLSHGTRELDVLSDIEQAAAQLRAGDVALTSYRDRQRCYGRELAKITDGKWLVSDFVTLGSPLAHAHFLLVDDFSKPLVSEIDQASDGWLGKRFGLDKDNRDKAAFERVATLFGVRAVQREFPVAPPQTEEGDRFSYRPKPREPRRLLHHAAPFAPVRWTNIFAEFHAVILGDPVAGSIAPLFGPGAKDVPLKGGAASAPFAHGVYWKLPKRRNNSVPPHIDELRKALNLADKKEAES
jgi:hypothetical protein